LGQVLGHGFGRAGGGKVSYECFHVFLVVLAAGGQVIMNNCIRCHTELTMEMVKLGKMAGEFRVPADLLVGHQLPPLRQRPVHSHL
jgi:hypothetical protein